MDSKVIKGKWHQNETPPVYSCWTKVLSCKFSEWWNIVHTTYWAPKLPEQNKFFILGATLDLPVNKHAESNQAQCLSITSPPGLFSERSIVDSWILPVAFEATIILDHPTKNHIFCIFKIQYGGFDKFWKFAKLKNLKFFWRTTTI